LSVKVLMQESTARATVPLASEGSGRLIIKSISAKQRPRRPPEYTPAPPAEGAGARKTKTAKA
jgi:hypothetical protein